MIPGLLAAAVPGLASGLMGLVGGERANAANAAQAQKQMDFQERMSNTSYQRAVKDLEAAGLNPALAYTKGGADTPGGARAEMQNTIGPAATSATQAAQGYASVAEAVSRISKTNAEADKAKTEADMLRTQQGFLNAMVKNQSERDAALTQWQTGFGPDTYYPLLTKQMQADIEATNAHAGQARMQTQMGSLQLPGMQNAANAANTWWGRNIMPFLNSASDVARIGTTLASPFVLRNMGRNPVKPITINNNLETRDMVGRGKKVGGIMYEDPITKRLISQEEYRSRYGPRK